MGLTYFKRFRMEIDLTAGDFCQAWAPPHYDLVPWDESLIDAHAEAKFHSFRGEIDSNVFPCLGDYAGCHRLMHEIRHKDGFLPGATWLARYQRDGQGRREACGTIQGIRDYAGVGAVQNLGVTPEHRGRGLGAALLRRALEGFWNAGLQRAFLEVTAQNVGAIHLYQSLGFVKARTVYKAVEVAYTYKVASPKNASFAAPTHRSLREPSFAARAVVRGAGQYPRREPGPMDGHRQSRLPGNPVTRILLADFLLMGIPLQAFLSPSNHRPYPFAANDHAHTDHDASVRSLA
jgi:ribosomal protein S18 acetylase RimI-like enzyme